MGTNQTSKQGDDQQNDAMRSDNVGRDQIKSIVERVERLQEEKKAIAEDIKEVYMEAKANGFDTKTLRKVIALRKIEASERQEQEAMLDLYMSALGMQPSFDFDND